MLIHSAHCFHDVYVLFLNPLRDVEELANPVYDITAAKTNGSNGTADTHKQEVQNRYSYSPAFPPLYVRNTRVSLQY